MADQAPEATQAGFEVRLARGKPRILVAVMALLTLAIVGVMAYFHFSNKGQYAVVVGLIGVPAALLSLGGLSIALRAVRHPILLVITAEGLAFGSPRLRKRMLVPWAHIREFRLEEFPQTGRFLWIDLYPWAPKPTREPGDGRVRERVGPQYFLPGDLLVPVESLEIEPDALLRMLRRHHAQRRKDSD